MKLTNSWVRGAGLLCVVASLGAVGCAEDGSPQQESTSNTVAEGLVITEASPAQGLHGTFTKGGRTIRFSAVRGDRTPDEARAVDPDAPEYPVDARFTDAKGDGFIVSGGEDTLKDPSWSPAAINDPRERTKDLELVPALLDELETADISADMGPERSRLASLGRSIRDQQLVVPPGEDEQGYACTAGYQHQMYVMYKAAFGVTPFDHSAIWLVSWYRDSACTWYYQGKQVSCNHGTCADVDPMVIRCEWNSAIRSYAWPAFQRYNPWDPYGTGACTTPYSAFSGSGSHNCNDDTYFQAYNIRQNATWSSGVGPNSICIDSTSHYYAPDCVGNR